MLKNWKSLFVKTEETETKTSIQEAETFSFPVGQNQTGQVTSQQPEFETSPVLDEVLKVYESGLDSINMPGYDFFEFYKSVTSVSHQSENIYSMAFQMAKTLDSSITIDKLIKDAEFYISKINEVHSQYVTQGQGKLSSLNEKKKTEKNKLNTEIEQASTRVNQLKAELQQLESDINKKRSIVAGIDQNYLPQENSIREKLLANDVARKNSIDKLMTIKDGIFKYIK